MKQYQYENIISMLYFIMALSVTSTWVRLLLVVAGTVIGIKSVVSATKEDE